jgi:hypothetical protein
VTTARYRFDGADGDDDLTDMAWLLLNTIDGYVYRLMADFRSHKMAARTFFA